MFPIANVANMILDTILLNIFRERDNNVNKSFVE